MSVECENANTQKKKTKKCADDVRVAQYQYIISVTVYTIDKHI